MLIASKKIYIQVLPIGTKKGNPKKFFELFQKFFQRDTESIKLVDYQKRALVLFQKWSERLM